VISTARRAWAMMRHPGLRGELFWVTLGQGGLLFGGLVTIKVLTNLLGPVVFGEFALALSLVSVFGSLLHGPMGQAVTRFWPVAQSSGAAADYLRWIRRGFGLSVLICFALLVIGIPIVAALVGRSWIALLAAAGLLALATGGNAVCVALLNGMRVRKPMALLQVGEPLLRIASAVIAIALIGRSGWAAMVGSALGAAIVLGGALIYLRGRVRSDTSRPNRQSRGLASEMTAYVIPFVLLSLFGLVGFYGDRWIIQAKLGLADVGVYAAMFQVGNAPVVALLAVLNQFAYPLMFEAARERVGGEAFNAGRSAYFRFLALSAAAIGGVVLCAYLFGELVLAFLTSRDYTTYHDGLWLIVLGAAFVNFGQQLVMKGLLFATPSVYVLPRAVHSATFLALGLWLGASVVGICSAVALSSAVYLVGILIANRYLGSTRPGSSRSRGV
jgi:O-antigen/teichoic acid export membrane protein